MRRRSESELQETVERLARRVEELEGALRKRGRPTLPAEAPGWQEGGTADDGPEATVSHQWLSILEPPIRNRRRLPRLPFEALFLALVAVAAGVADLEPLWIAAAMGGGWLLVALIEWSATLADRRRAERDAIPPPALVPVVSGRPDQAWYIPPVEQTLTHGTFLEGATAITRLRKHAPEEAEETIERRIADTQV